MTINLNKIYDVYKTIIKKSKPYITLPTINVGDEDVQNIISPFYKEDYAAWLLFDNAKDTGFLNNFLNSYLTDDYFHDDDIKKTQDLLYKSYVSVFKIKKTSDRYFLDDLLTSSHFEIEYSPELDNLTSDYSILRVISIKDNNMVLHVLRNLNEFLAISLPQEFLSFLSSKTNGNTDKKVIIQAMKDYLPDILAIYHLINSSTSDDSLAIQKANDLQILDEAFNKTDFEIFVYFMNNYNDSDLINSEIMPTIIISFFKDCYQYFLKPKSLSFKDYDIDYNQIIEKQCRNGYYINNVALKSQLNMLYSFYTLLKDRGKQVDFIIKSLQKAKSNIFRYQNLLKSSTSGFYVEEDIYNCVRTSNFDFDESPFLEDYETFLDYVDYYYLTILSSGDISPKLLEELSEELEITPTKDVKTVKNHHFPLLQLFINFSVEKDILKKETFLNNTFWTLGKNSDKYLILPPEVKLSLWIQAVLNENFLKKTFRTDENKYSEFIVNFITNLTLNNRIIKKDIKKEFLPLLDGLERVGIIECDRFYKLSSLGKNLYNHFSKAKKKDNIIKVDFSK